MVATYQAAARLIQCYIENRCYGNSGGYSYQELVSMLEQNLQTIRELESEQLPDSYSDDESNNKGDYNNYSNNGDGDGRNSASGIYFYKLESEGFSDVKRMVMAK